jgi:hypothetical protein
MSANRDRPHVFVLPEDDDNSRIANGFWLEVGRMRQLYVCPVAGGWNAVVDQFESDQVADMNRYSTRYMVLLIDFDGRLERLDDVKSRIPDNLRDRVFVLGSLREPKDLKTAGLGSYEAIGSALARDCREGTDETWRHELLRHNADEVARLREHVRPILFPLA